jgi:hypothetical protein
MSKYRSEDEPTRRGAWRGLVRHLLGVITGLQQINGGLRAEIDRLVTADHDEVLAKEVRQRHELLEDFTRVDKWLEEEKAKHVETKAELREARKQMADGLILRLQAQEGLKAAELKLRYQTDLFSRIQEMAEQGKPTS